MAHFGAKVSGEFRSSPSDAGAPSGDVAVPRRHMPQWGICVLGLRVPRPNRKTKAEREGFFRDSIVGSFVTKSLEAERWPFESTWALRVFPL